MPARLSSTAYAIGLYRVSTAEQGQSGLGLEAQQASVRAFAAAQGWTLVAEFSDVASGCRAAASSPSIPTSPHGERLRTNYGKLRKWRQWAI